MPSNNPVFRNSDEFKSGYNSYGNASYAGNGAGYSGYGDPSTWSVGTPGAPTAPARATGPMTIDTVVQRTAISIVVVFVAALATWVLTPSISSEQNLNAVYSAAVVGSLGAFVLSMVNSFKRIISPALVIAFAAFEGVALGALSKTFDAAFGSGVVTGAVLGTFAAFAGTLAAYKYFDIQVGNKFRTMVLGAVLGMVGLSVLELVLSLFGSGLGLFGFGALGLLTSVIGLALGVFMLVMDFDFVEQGVRNGLPERESWRAAFAMTVSLVWIYTNLLRLLAIVTNNR
ncbi:Bax inhibitor-1/YccA family protein [Nocardioides sp. BP30]|uniref:Bax inhibitor-1/YccA family protein n=1 Tax=Nocardioides sp. BP30 TaxID=3036374 RepID=UPI0024689550|nr:Bax inhibitor-1/YccA family protein [Nocardioides sp. BP30]WGL53354.1 Bax inhibitor-1/YccA family protein [Nocardioides sp. BP30]